MSLNITVDLSRFESAIRRLSILTDKSNRDIFLRAARSIISNSRGAGLLQITPPASAKTTGSAAKRAGEAAIDRDLARIFTGVKLKHKRREQYPDVVGIHARLFADKKPGRPIPLDKNRGFYHVDVQKLRALRAVLFRNIGYLASGWCAAAQRLGVPVPAWIGRHGARGTIQLTLSSSVSAVEMTNIAPDNAPVEELERRVPYAINYEIAALEREVDFLSQENGKSAGFKTAA